MSSKMWDFVYSITAIAIVWAIFLRLADRKRWREYFVAFEYSAFIAELICSWAGVYDYWHYPTKAYDEFTAMLIKNLLFFSVFGLIYVHYFKDRLYKNIFLALAMAGLSTVLEAITLYTTELVGYSEKMNFYITYTTYLIGYLFVMGIHYIYTGKERVGSV